MPNAQEYESELETGTQWFLAFLCMMMVIGFSIAPKQSKKHKSNPIVQTNGVPDNSTQWPNWLK